MWSRLGKKSAYSSLLLIGKEIQNFSKWSARNSRFLVGNGSRHTGLQTSHLPGLKNNCAGVPRTISVEVGHHTIKQYPKDLDSAEGIDLLLDRYDTFLIDCDGVLWGNDHSTLFRNINLSVENLRRKNKRLIFVTNNNMHARGVYLDKFKVMCGFEAGEKDIFSVCFATALYLKSVAKVSGKIYHLGSKGMSEELDQLGLDHIGYGLDPDPITDDKDKLLAQRLDPDVCTVLVGFDIHLGYNKLYKAASYLSRHDCLYVSTSDVETRVPIGKNRIQPLTGVITEAINAVSGRKPVVIGKPYKHLMDCVMMEHPDIDLNRTVMLGDSIKTDIGFAKNTNIDSVLVLSGSTSLETMNQFYAEKKNEIPTYYLSSFDRFAHI